VVSTDALAHALWSIDSAAERGKRQVPVRLGIKAIVWLLTVTMKHGYIGEFEVIEGHRAGKTIVISQAG
jgi:small subunit ribosomal protein S15Ae